MGLFSRKKKEEVPELPPAPELPDLPEFSPEQKMPRNELPALPPSELGKNLNQEMVKSAVSDPGMEKEVLPNLPQDHFERPRGMIPSISSIPTSAQEVAQEAHFPIKPLPQKATLELSTNEEIKDTSTKPAESIFVKIKDFQAAQKDFKEVNKKISQIEHTLKKITTAKLKEDKEIASWIEELEAAKAKLSEMDSEIFSKL